jgi:hypothetical protein
MNFRGLEVSLILAVVVYYRAVHDRLPIPIPIANYIPFYLITLKA